MKGVSDKDAQNNKKIKGKKTDLKKPLQVLHLSKKENSFEKDVKVLEFIRYKVGEGV